MGISEKVKTRNEGGYADGEGLGTDPINRPQRPGKPSRESLKFTSVYLSPYLALKAFWPSPRIKGALRGLRLAALETIPKNMPKAEKAIARKK